MNGVKFRNAAILFYIRCIACLNSFDPSAEQHVSLLIKNIRIRTKPSNEQQPANKQKWPLRYKKCTLVTTLLNHFCFSSIVILFNMSYGIVGVSM